MGVNQFIISTFKSPCFCFYMKSFILFDICMIELTISFYKLNQTHCSSYVNPSVGNTGVMKRLLHWMLFMNIYQSKSSPNTL